MPPVYFAPPAARERVWTDMMNYQAAKERARIELEQDPDLVQRTADLAHYYGPMHVAPGVITGAAKMGLRPWEPAMAEIAKRSMARPEIQPTLASVAGAPPGDWLAKLKNGLVWFGDKTERLWDTIDDAPRVATRAAFMALDTVSQEVLLRPLRAIQYSFDDAIGRDVSGGGDDGFWSLYTNWQRAGESTGLKALRNLVDTGDAQVGAGYFAGGASYEQAATDNQLRTPPSEAFPEGEPYSTGRWAFQMAEPGSLAYNIGSGTIDAALAVYADPANIALKAGARVAAARRNFSLPSHIQNMDDVKRYFGVTMGDRRPDVHPGMYVERFLTQEKRGRALVDTLAETDDTEFIWKALGRHPHRRLVGAIRDNDDPAMIRRLLSGQEIPGEGLGLSIRDKPSRWATSQRYGWPHVRRLKESTIWGEEIPGPEINIEDLDVTMESYDQYLRNNRLPDDVRRELLDRYVDLEDGDMAGALDLVLDTAGHTDDVIRRDPTLLDALVPKPLRDSNPRTNYHLVNAYKSWMERIHEFQSDDLIIPHLQRSVRTLELDGGSLPFPVPSQADLNELIDGSIPLLEFREARRATSRLAPYLDSGLMQPTIGALESGTRWWKQTQLMRIAYTTRVLGEELLLRLGAAGLDSPLHHPADWLGWVLADDQGRLARLLDDIPLVNPKGHTDILGRVLAASDEFRAARSPVAGDWVSDIIKNVGAGDWVEYSRRGTAVGHGARVNDKEFATHWLSALSAHHRNPITNRLAQGSDFRFGTRQVDIPTGPAPFLDELTDVDKQAIERLTWERARQWMDENTPPMDMVRGKFGRPPLRPQPPIDDIREQVTRELRQRRPRRPGPGQTDVPHAETGEPLRMEELVGDDAVKEWLWSSEEGIALRNKYAKGGGDSRGWVDDAVARNVKYNDDRMYGSAREFSDAHVDAARLALDDITGGNEDLLSAIRSGTLDDADINHLTDFTQRFGHIATTRQTRRDAGKLLGQYLDSAPEQVLGVRTDKTILNRWDGFVDTMFDFLMAAPSNRLTRSPAARQFYWQRIDELLPRVDASQKDAIVAMARENNYKLRYLDQIGTGDVLIPTIDDVDLIAKQYMLNQTRDLLYSLDRRGQWSDILRNIVPFGEAWKEVLGTWARLVRQRPNVVRRAQQVIEAARGQDRDPATGFFRTDDDGVERFHYPLVSNLATWMVGDRLGGDTMVDATGRVQGLNLVATGLLPGLSPFVALPASTLIPSAPAADRIRNLVLPFGEESIEREGGIGAWLESAVTPAWLKKAIAAFQDLDSDTRKNDYRYNIAISMVNEGRFAPEELEQALKAAEAPTDVMLFLQGALQFILPTGPEFDQMLRTKGAQRYVEIDALAQELGKLKDQYGSWEAAQRQFQSIYGVDPFLLQPGNRNLKERSFETTGWRWEREHRQLIDEVVPHVGGYFAPTGEDDVFEIDAWVDAKFRGDVVPLTSKERVELANNARGMAAYREAQRTVEEMGLSPEDESALLKAYRRDLMDNLPGYDTILDRLPGRPKTAALIAEIERGLEHDEFRSTPAGEAMAEYLDARRTALRYADGTSLTGKSDATIREALRQYGGYLVSQVPDFGSVWGEVFLNEIDEDLEEEEQ